MRARHSSDRPGSVESGKPSRTLVERRAHVWPVVDPPPGRVPAMLTIGSLADRALHEAGRLATKVLVTRNVVRIDPVTRELVLDGGASLHARTVVLATSVT